MAVPNDRNLYICDDVQPDANEIFQLLLWLFKLQECLGSHVPKFYGTVCIQVSQQAPTDSS